MQYISVKTKQLEHILSMSKNDVSKCSWISLFSTKHEDITVITFMFSDIEEEESCHIGMALSSGTIRTADHF